MRFYRIADSRHSPENGEGARIHGGRWNSPGRAVIYACDTVTGAMLEKLVHTSGRMPRHQVCVTYESAGALAIESLEPSDVPGWDQQNMIASRRAGDAWLVAGESVVLRVPSVIFDVERNVLINPAHADFRTIRVIAMEAVRWDERLFDEQASRSTS
ncbi:MAG: RES family NAD+ phosphorylase [Steroidobacteraceae bacterium]